MAGSTAAQMCSYQYSTGTSAALTAEPRPATAAVREGTCNMTVFQFYPCGEVDAANAGTCDATRRAVALRAGDF